MNVDQMLGVLKEHEALESDARVALLLPAIVHLRGHPLNVSFIIFEGCLNLGYRIADL